MKTTRKETDFRGRRTQRVVVTGRTAFTLIELLVVIAIISLLVSILLPSLAMAKDLAKAAMCSSQTRNMALAFLVYREEWDHLPWSAYGAATSGGAYKDTIGLSGLFSLRMSVAEALEDNFGLDTTFAYTCPAGTVEPRRWWADSSLPPGAPPDPPHNWNVTEEIFVADDYCFYTYLDGKDLTPPMKVYNGAQGLSDDTPVATHNNLSSDHAMLGCTCLTIWGSGTYAYHYTDSSYRVTLTAYGDAHVETVSIKEGLFEIYALKGTSNYTGQYSPYQPWYYWWK